jgi:hypothetical protein
MAALCSHDSTKLDCADMHQCSVDAFVFVIAMHYAGHWILHGQVGSRVEFAAQTANPVLYSNSRCLERYKAEVEDT